jgi:hypothetical protein
MDGATNNNDANEAPKTEKKVTSKKIVKQINSPEVNEVIKQALREYIRKNNEISRTEIELDAMVSTCQEFLQSFIIFGYTFDGQPIDPIFFAHNQQEADALSMYLTKFFNAHVVNGGQNNSFK